MSAKNLGIIAAFLITAGIVLLLAGQVAGALLLILGLCVTMVQGWDRKYPL